MKDYIQSFLIDYIDDNPNCGLSTNDILDASDYMWMNFDLTDIDNQLDNLLHDYLAKHSTEA